MKKTFCLIKMTFLTNLAYIKAFWLNMTGTVASIFIYYFLWQFVFRKQETLAGYTMAQMTTYVILSRMLASQFSGGINRELSEWIKKGTIGVELLRPISLLQNLFAKRTGEFLYFILFKGLPVSIIAFLILGGSLPAGRIEFLLFMCSICLGMVIMFFFEFMVGICAFYTYASYGLAFTKTALLSILSGGIVPLFLFPEGVAKILNYLPFAGMVSVPVNIYLGKYPLQQAIQYMGLQVIWIVLLGILAQVLYSRVVCRIVVQGG